MEHFTESEINRFAVSALPIAKLDDIANHLAECETCHQVLVKSLRSQRASDGLRFSLDPAFLFRHDHLDYDQLVGVAEQKLDATEQEITDIHLRTCATCREDLRSFLAFRKEIEPELRVRYGPVADKPRETSVAPSRRWKLWKPAYIAAMIIIAIGLLIGVLYMRRRGENLEARQTPPPNVNTLASATPTPESRAANNLPTPAPLPSQRSPVRAPSPALVVRDRQPTRTPGSVETVAVLNDGEGKVTVDKAGNVAGLDQISDDTRREVAEAVTTQTIRTPDTVTELAGVPMTLRGPDEGPKFKLRSPARTVILSDRPSFQWDALPGAASYQVSVADLNGHLVARSEQLSSDRTTWTPPSTLKRGEIYAWDVVAVVDGEKVFAPGTSETQMKFKVLSEQNARELEQLKKANSHLALGVFYAREGMLTEAEGEFQILIHDNPKSPMVKTLLNQIQSWSHR
jgi:hypothetical protein